MKKLLLFVFVSFPLFSALAQETAASCAGALPICSSLGVPFLNTSGVTVSQPGIDFGCLGSQPNPKWFYFPISQSGSINLKIEQNASIGFDGMALDVDFICYGPFTSPGGNCSVLNVSTIVDCSFSAASVEEVNVANAVQGEFYLLMVTNFNNSPGYIRITDLGGTGEINCAGFQLNAFLDSNANGLKDTGEVNFPLGQFHYEVNGDGNVHNISTPTGTYAIYEDSVADSYDLSYTLSPVYASSYSVSTTAYDNVNIIPGASLQTYLFPVVSLVNYNDVGVSLVPTLSPNAGFVHNQKIVYANHGNQTVASGTITYTKDVALSVNSVSDPSAIIAPGGFTYTFANLLPFETREISVELQVPPIPTVQLGQQVMSSVTIGPLLDDVFVADNTSSAVETIVGSYDPNDKMELRGPQILFSSFDSDDYLYYTIRFENTGTAPALTIRIEDVLDEKLNPSTVAMVSASHNYVLDRIDGSLVWVMENAALLPSVPNSNVGKGYLQFRVKPNPGYAVGDVISNTANIYFDFNPAIVTNTFTSTFVSQLQVDEFEQQTLVVYPNPVDDYVTISLKDNSDIETITIYDVTGKRLLQTSNNTVDLSSAAPGLYFADVLTRDKIKFTRKLVVK